MVEDRQGIEPENFVGPGDSRNVDGFGSVSTCFYIPYVAAAMRAKRSAYRLDDFARAA